MAKKKSRGGFNRRSFLKKAAVATTTPALLSLRTEATPEQTGQTEPPTYARPPSSSAAALEVENPAEYNETEQSRYFINDPGSDFMVDTIKSLGIRYMTSNPGSSFRGLHESVVNYGGNRNPEFITCLHEESAVAMGHGFAKAAGKPLAAACHGTVGLQHAAMAVYNAWCDRAPVIIFAGNRVDAELRRPGVEWAHAVQDAVKPLRDFVKWDAMPLSLQHFAEATVRAYKIATTPPMGPVVIVVDAELQEQAAEHKPELPAFSATVPPQGDENALDEAAQWLINAERPLIIADRLARTPAGMQHLLDLAETLQAPVIDKLGRMNFPTGHYLNQSGLARRHLRDADVILGLELNDFWGSVARVRDLPQREEVSLTRSDVRLISLGAGDVYLKSNYQNFQRFLAVNMAIAGDAEVSLPVLTRLIQEQLSSSQRGKIEQRKAVLQKAFNEMREFNRKAASHAWNARPISTARLCMELWQQIKNHDWSLVSDTFFQSFWPQRLWDFNQHHQFMGGSGGYGVGYGAPAAAGCALANRDEGRLSVNIQSDGDLLYAPGILWTTAHHDIPLLSVIHNNRAYHQEIMHVQRTALRRQRGADGQAKIGNVFEDPKINFSDLAKSMGVWAAGPVEHPDELAPTLERAIDIVSQGSPAVVDVISQPR